MEDVWGGLQFFERFVPGDLEQQCGEGNQEPKQLLVNEGFGGFVRHHSSDVARRNDKRAEEQPQRSEDDNCIAALDRGNCY